MGLAIIAAEASAFAPIVTMMRGNAEAVQALLDRDTLDPVISANLKLQREFRLWVTAMYPAFIRAAVANGCLPMEGYLSKSESLKRALMAWAQPYQEWATSPAALSLLESISDETHRLIIEAMNAIAQTGQTRYFVHGSVQDMIQSEMGNRVFLPLWLRALDSGLKAWYRRFALPVADPVGCMRLQCDTREIREALESDPYMMLARLIMTGKLMEGGHIGVQTARFWQAYNGREQDPRSWEGWVALHGKGIAFMQLPGPESPQQPVFIDGANRWFYKSPDGRSDLPVPHLPIQLMHQEWLA